MIENDLRQVSGEDAAAYKVVRLDSLADAHTGLLLSADVDTGRFSWVDAAGETKSADLGSHRIRIARRT
jgi:hypothetical protein